MSNFSKYSAAISEFFDNCDLKNTDDLQEAIYVLEVGLLSAVSTLSTWGTDRKENPITDAYCDALRNLTWLVVPATNTTEQCSVEKAVTSVCALAAAKSQFLATVHHEKSLEFKNEFIETVQKCSVAAVMSVLVTGLEPPVGEEVMDAMRSEYLDAISEVNKEFVNRWSEFLLSKYGIGFKAKKV